LTFLYFYLAIFSPSYGFFEKEKNKSEGNSYFLFYIIFSGRYV